MTDFSLRGLINHMLDVVRQPEMHMREIPVLVGLAILVTFIVLVFIALIFVRPKRDGEDGEDGGDEKSLRRGVHGRYLAILILGLLMTLAVSIATGYSAKPSFCAGCHEMRQEYTRSLKSVHAKVECLSCHQEPGMTGIAIQKLQLVEMAVAKTGVAGGVYASSVTDEACLRCHKDVLTGVQAVGSLRVKHEEPVAAGFKCTDCHYQNNLFHVNSRKLDEFGMSRCVECHNDKRASASCDTCHIRGQVRQSRVSHGNYPMAEMRSSAPCKSCHLPNSCLSCHKLQMPHTPAFKARDHALEGFVYKQVCLECHDQAACKKCHPRSFPHSENWAKLHGSVSGQQAGICSSCHDSAFCQICHADTVQYKLKRELPRPGR